jgi:carbamoyltransferase
MKILGLVSENHDSGLALLDGGVPVAILEEERFTREKHTLNFPFLAMKAIFEDGGRSIDDIEVITTPWDPKRLRKTYRRILWENFPASLHLLRPKAHPTQDGGTVILNYWMRKDLRTIFGKKRRLPEIVNVGHHEAHAAIFFASPFEEATTLVIDGHGDDAATSVYTGRDNRLERQWSGSILDSLGVIYTVVTCHLGFHIFEEGTVMALAACGGDTYVEKARDLVRLHDDGRFSINMEYFSYDKYGMLWPVSRKFLDVFGPARRRDEPLTDHHRDLARALQTVAEDVVIHIARHLTKQHPSRNLCLTGGVALNCVANARILRDTDFERVWVPPCASDTGVPLGSALWHYHQTLGHPRAFEMTHPFFGQEFSDQQIKSALDRAGMRYEILSEAELIERAARDLAADKVVGWFQGREEIGPRALGNRSILASPLKAEIREVINKRVKFREAFRPFAPAVLQEYASEYFEISQPDPFMTMAPRVKADKADKIPAAVHVDGTARIQTVDRRTNPRYYGVIEAFMKLTGVPVVLNTSFNKQEPIVSRPEEAISCFLRTEMDVLTLGNFYTTDRSPETAARAKETFRIKEANMRGGE